MDKPELRVNDVFGESAEDARLLAASPDEDTDWTAQGPAKEPPPARTAILSLAHGGPRFQEWVPGELRDAWRSSNGTVYCAVASGEVMVLADGTWAAERALDDAETELSFVTGSSGATPLDDRLIVVGGQRALVRQRATWVELDVPENAGLLGRPAIRSASEAYFVSESGLLMWDGHEVTFIESPDDELRGVLVRPSGDLLATGEKGLHHWSEARQKWVTHRSPVRLRAAIAELDEMVFLATKGGVLAWDGKRFDVSTKELDCTRLRRLGGGHLFALGRGGGFLMRAGDAWRRVAVPAALLPRTSP